MIFFANGLRGLLLTIIVAIVVLSVMTLRRYASTARRTPPEARRSLHIAKVAASHIGLLCIVALETINRIGMGVTPLLIVTLVLATLTLSALIDLLYYQRFTSSGTDESSPA